MTAMSALAWRDWVPEASETLVQQLAGEAAGKSADALDAELMRLAGANRATHEADCINLNPATNLMNPKAERMLGLPSLGNRPSLGYPGAKYEMGLEAIERIEVIAQQLAAEIFDARFVEYRVASGAMANLYVFMAAAKPGDAIIVPPPSIAGHVTHHGAGAAGLYGLEIHQAKADPTNFTIDLGALRDQAHAVSPKLITIGGSLNLLPHPLQDIRDIADEVGALVLYDAAHMSGMIAGRAWQQPLAEGADFMTMSTYKSLGGPAGGLVLTNEPELARRLDAIAYPGLTANFDIAKTSALAMTLLDWREHGRAYAAAMGATAKALANALAAAGLPVHGSAFGFTSSHAFALESARWGGGQTAAARLRRANILTSGIGLPIAELAGDSNGLRLGTPEIVRAGMGPEHMEELAGLIVRMLIGNDVPEAAAAAASALRQRFSGVHFVRQ